MQEQRCSSTPFTLMRFKPRFYQYYCRRKAAVVLRKIEEGFRSDRGQYGSFTVFAIYLRLVAFWSAIAAAWNE